MYQPWAIPWININKVEEVKILTTDREVLSGVIEVGKMNARRVQDILENNMKSFLLFKDKDSWEEFHIHKDAIVFIEVLKWFSNIDHSKMKKQEVIMELRIGDTRLVWNINLWQANNPILVFEKKWFIPVMDADKENPKSVYLVNQSYIKFFKEWNSFNFNRNRI